MAEPSMPQHIIDWMDDRQWGWHHLEWHTVRQWDLIGASGQQWATSQGWGRANRQEGEAGNGLEFLVMHRAMIELLKRDFPTQASLFQGWSQVPTDPDDVNDPVPANVQPRAFRTSMLSAVDSLARPTFLASFPNDDAFGLYIETSRRPGGFSADTTTGIHNYIHGRFSVPGDPVNMGDPELNLGNERFWRLHGWIDARWTAFRIANGLPAMDSTLRSLIDTEKTHLDLHHTLHHGMRSALVARRRTPVSVRRSDVPLSIKRPFEETLQKRFASMMEDDAVPTTVEDLQDMLQVAIELEWFTLPPYLTALWSLKDRDTHPVIRNILLSVAMEEMLHMSLCCNLLVALGGKPKLLDPATFPSYPDFPPGILMSTPVALQKLSLDAIRLFMEIEKPVRPIVIRSAAHPAHAVRKKAPTIGEFYARLLLGIRSVNPPFRSVGQVTTGAMPELIEIDSIAAAERAIGLIVEQGEGTTASASAGALSDDLAHYYRYQQILDGMEFTRQPDETYTKDPTKPIVFPGDDEIHDIAIVPEGGYPGVEKAKKFDRNYTNMIAKLHAAWDSGDSSLLEESFGQMHSLTGLASSLMSTPIPGGSGNYGPAFGYLPPPAPLPDPTPTDIAATGSVSAAMAPQAMRRGPNIVGLALDGNEPSSKLDGLCSVVGMGGVGESGATAILLHQVASEGGDKVMVLKTVSSSLCPNQGAIASLIVDGVPVGTKAMSEIGSSIQATAAPGSNIAAISHMVPLFNRVTCVRLGELILELRECGLEILNDGGSGKSSMIETRSWFAWIDKQPIGPAIFRVQGEVEVANPGVVPTLVFRSPQGINPRMILLDLLLVQSSGTWPQQVVWNQSKYERIKGDYDAVQIFYNNDSIANVPVDTIS